MLVVDLLDLDLIFLNSKGLDEELFKLWISFRAFIIFGTMPLASLIFKLFSFSRMSSILLFLHLFLMLQHPILNIFHLIPNFT